jgi:hypothetical protein
MTGRLFSFSCLHWLLLLLLLVLTTYPMICVLGCYAAS